MQLLSVNGTGMMMMMMIIIIIINQSRYRPGVAHWVPGS